MLKQKILNKAAGILTYGLTPPKSNNTPEKISEIAGKQIERIRDLPLDGLLIYDIQDEADRIGDERPFPFLHTVDSAVYANDYLRELQMPKIIYRCVGKYSKPELAEWITGKSRQDKYSVFVGASAKQQQVNIGLPEAYQMRSELNPNLLLGGVLIPERHSKYHDEHLRMIDKMDKGCQYFISQAVYNVETTKNVLSDYYYHCQNHHIDMVPILINLTPCGSIKTLEFMKWLGVNIPKWLENDLMNSQDILDQSIMLSKQIFEELLDFAVGKGIPIGCSVESVSTRKVEIEASIQMVQDIQGLFARHLVARI
ncbi:5,10-methylenetetrahydrofolate reductase [Anaerosporomusa subterranea]|uniref:Methylenetetrahydrofolate reductase n=1 Tax=Anaerosporomusa subterranea TaxID=1794912 RepID=A0A154BLZ6_ANASB|nr:methylenetetrahydrofolate reductase [Anaerosporomusa subterranea]KYZ74942.1 5,10-methylenetetrahydrofolate reductase [Anaerosporomusa subterranea]